MKRAATLCFDLFVVSITLSILMSGCSKNNPTAPATGTISGTVTDATTNKPIGSATVTLGSLTTSTSFQGTYSFSDVPAGTYTLTVTAGGYASQSKQVQVSQGTSQTLNFSLQPAATTVSGTVIDATTSTPVPSATVTLGSQTTTTSSAGSYTFSNVQPGSYTITASANGYNSTSKQIQVSGGVPQTVDLSLQAVQKTISLGQTLNAGYYGWQPFSFDSYPFVQCSGGVMNHNVKVTVTINPTPNPVNIIVMRPDGYYKFEVDSTTGGLNKSFLTNACGYWEIIVWNYGNAQTTYSGNVSIDFSNYLASSDDISSQVQVPINYPSISAGTGAYFFRFLKKNMTYSLQLNISGGSNNDINLRITNPDGSYAFNGRVSGSYNSQTFTATSDGLQLFDFDNSFSFISSKSVTGFLLINRGTSSGNLLEGRAKTVK